MSNTASNLLGQQDDLDKLISQSQAVLISLTANENFRSLNDETISGNLWLLNDHIDKIKKQFDSLCEGIKS